MKRFNIVSVFLLVILLLAACGPAPTASPASGSPTEAVASPNSYGQGGLPMIKPGLSDADWAEFNPDKLVDYLIAGSLISYGNEFHIESAHFTDGELYLTITAFIYLRNVDTAYQYFQDKFSMTESEFTSLPDFSDCSLYEGKMYTADALEYLKDPEAYNENTEPQVSSYFDLNYVFFDDVMLPDVPVADDALITLFDEEKMIPYETKTEQFGEFLTSNAGVSGQSPMVNYVLIKYYDGQIRGIEEEYWD